jgi:hypothetical protein
MQEGGESVKYRKKPVVIEAIQYDGSGKSISDIYCNLGNKFSIRGDNLYIQTLEGEMRANVGDYIIKGVNGELYPCKPDIFEKIYEPVNEDT